LQWRIVGVQMPRPGGGMGARGAKGEATRGFGWNWKLSVDEGRLV
jgi:hypothetical protein